MLATIDMSVELVMPKAGLTNTEGTIAEWKVENGSQVTKGQIVLEVENEKTSFEVASTADGWLHIESERGDVILVGGKMATIAETKEEYESLGNAVATPVAPVVLEVAVVQQEVVAKKQETPEGAYIKASPLAKKMAKMEDVSLQDVTATGPGGRILARDIEAFMAEREAKAKMAVAPQVASGQMFSEIPQTSVISGEEPTIIPLTSIRKAVAKNMYNSLHGMAQTSDSVAIDVTDLLAMRKSLNDMSGQMGTKITINDILSYAAIRMLKKHPLANAMMTEDAIVTFPYVHLSMAVATEGGLTSPVVKFADRMTLSELSKALASVVERARDNRLTMDELTGGTFTITNMGIFPVDSFNPIVNPPQSAIIGFGRCVEKPWVYNGEIVIRTMMTLNITYDHRVFDGSEVGLIMRDMKEYLEHPMLMLI